MIGVIRRRIGDINMEEIMYLCFASLARTPYTMFLICPLRRSDETVAELICIGHKWTRRWIK